MVQNLHFVSYGSSRRYLRLSRQTLRALSAIYPLAKCMVISTRDLGQEAAAVRKYARRFPRGYGYWRWKPLAVAIAMRLSKPGDVIIYLDGRSGPPTSPVPWVDRLVASPSLEVSAWQMDSQPEYKWSTGDLLDHFGFDMTSPEVLSGQFAGGLFGLRHCDSAWHLLEDWASVVISRSELCRDEPSALVNHPEFVENRHDQSAFSLAIKSHMRAGLLLETLGQQDVSGHDAIRPQEKRHPRRIPNLSTLWQVRNSGRE